MQHIIDYRGWRIVVARNYGNTTINAYSDTIPVEQLTATSVENAKKAIDKLLA